MTIRFHLDEHVHPGIAIGLQAHGVDVTTTVGTNLLGAEDAEHAAFAVREGRVIVTHDDDFLRLHSQGTSHAGIAFCHRQKYLLGEIIQMLLLLHACYTAEEMSGRAEFL